jgi:formylglycine-generating enzyme required for sulfatase activity
MWEEQDASDVLLSLSLNYPKIGFLAVTAYDVTGVLPAFFPIPCVQGVEHIDRWLHILNSLTEDLRGTEISGYQLTGLVGQNEMARIYSAHQPAIRRDVQLILLPTLATEEEKKSFRQIASARAGNTHPVIYAIYEEDEVDGRAFIAQEPINAPNLLQLSLENTTFESRILAKIMHTAGTAIKHHQTHKIPYQPLRSSHITLSQEGVIKFMNTALPAEYSIPSEQEQLQFLAQIIREFVPTGEPLHTGLNNLLVAMESGTVLLDDVVRRSNAIDIELAPVKFTPQRQEAVIAEQQIKKARHSFWVATIIGVVALSLFGTWFIVYALSSKVLVPPGKDFKTQLSIPAGTVNVSSKSFPVAAFHIDEYEVTIGQYKKFLEAVKDKNPQDYLPPDLKMEKQNFIPADWDNILKIIQKKKDLEGSLLTNDSPIFNIDYADAYAYAKWAGKRLPTELEWMRAAGGDNHFQYPWGSQADLSKANTGADKNTTSTQALAGSLDGFRGTNPVDAKDSDSSPFGVKGLAGNVSEWVQASPELGPLRANAQPYRGGHHGTDKLISNQLRTGGDRSTRNPFLGLRCASDTAVVK